jgi:hypothetical protein
MANAFVTMRNELAFSESRARVQKDDLAFKHPITPMRFGKNLAGGANVTAIRVYFHQLLGIYFGLSSFMAGQRSKEISVRKVPLLSSAIFSV